MFTVKMIDAVNQEKLIEADEVSLVFMLEGVLESGDGTPPPWKEYGKELQIVRNGEVTYVSSGQVYVMNANGKTVADYLFSMSPKAQELSRVGYSK